MTTDVNMRVAERDLKYYIFDWDNNILHMPTRIHLERRTGPGLWQPYAVSTALFSIIRKDTDNYRPPAGDWELAFREFRDIHVEDENIFLRDTRVALDRVVRGEEQPAPSFLAFKQTLIEGRLFAIVTARGHAPDIIRKAVADFIERVLTPREKADMLRNLRGYIACFDPDHAADDDAAVLDYYLSANKYHGCMSPHFHQLLETHGLRGVPTEIGKQFAIKDFVNHVIRIVRRQGLARPISVGFSDDDINNASAVETYVRDQLAREFPGVKFAVYYTSDPNLPAGRKVEVAGQLSLKLETAPVNT